MRQFKKHHDVDIATKDIEMILSHVTKKDKGAVPVKIDTAIEARDALRFKQQLFSLVRGFEATQPQAIMKANAAEQTAVNEQTIDDFNVTHCAYDILRLVLNEYFRG